MTQLVSLPKIHEKPILRLTLDEMQKMLEMSQTGDHLTKGQQKFHQLTAARDYAMLSLFLGTGIRVSECVGLDLEDIGFTQNAFLVTRKRRKSGGALLSSGSCRCASGLLSAARANGCCYLAMNTPFF